MHFCLPILYFNFYLIAFDYSEIMRHYIKMNVNEYNTLWGTCTK